MEGSSHSRTFSHHSRSHSRAQVFSGPTTYSGSKKPPIFPSTGNNGGFFTTSYDDVFGGPPAFAALAPRAEDYSEIFGAFRSSSSRASSIPVLDLPAVADIDAGASFLDYSEVFGGFEAVDFAVPYDELFRPFDTGDCSSDEAWTPVGTESLSDDSDPFAFSEKSPCFSDGNSHQSLDNKHFNVSYHKCNPGTSKSVSNMTHIAQLNAVPGYTCVVDEPTSTGQMINERLYSTIGDDIILNVDSSVFSQKHSNQTMSHMSHDAVKSFDENHRSGRARSVNMTTVNSTFASVSDNNHRIKSSHLPPSFRPPSVPVERKGDSSRLKPDPKGSENCCLEVNGIPFFDMDFDASSSAAASAAAMKDAMDKAHMKLKAAKFLVDRKKDNLQNSEDLSLNTDVNGGESVQMVHNECASKDERLPAASYRASVKIKSSGEDRPARNACSFLPNNSAVEQCTGVIEKSTEQKDGKKLSSIVETTFTEGVGEWKEATQYYEFINNDSGNLASLCPCIGDVKTEAYKQLDSDKHNSDSANEVCVPEENRRRLKATKAVSRQEYYEKMVKVAQEVHNTMIGGHAEAEKRLDDVPLENLKQHEGKLEKSEGQAQQVEVEKPFDPIRKEEEEIWLKNALEKDEIKPKENHSLHREQSDRNRNSPHQSRIQEVASMEEERRMRESYEWEYCEGRTQDSLLREADEQIVKEACEGQKNHKKPAGSTNQKKYDGSLEVKNNISREAFDISFDGKVLQTASESQEIDKMKDLQRRKVEENRKKEAYDGVVHVERLQNTCQSHQRNVDAKRSKEALEDIFYGERLYRTSEGRENVKTKGLLQVDEYENCAEDVEGQGTRKIFEEAVEPEDKNVPEQKKIKQRLYEAKKLGFDSRESGKERLAKSSREGRVESESIQTGELEETCKLPDTTSDIENQKTMHKCQVKIDQIDEDQEPNSPPETELPSQDVNLPIGVKLNENDFESNNATFKLKEPLMGAHDFLEVPAQEDNGEINPATLASDEESDLEAVETADVLIDERPTKSIVSQMDASDNEHKRSHHPPDCLYTKDSNTSSDEVYTGKGQTLSHVDKKGVPSVSGPKLARDFENEQEEKRNVLGEGQVLCDEEEEVRCTPAQGISGWSGQLRKKEVANTAMPKRKESIQKRSELPPGSQSIERKVKIVTEVKDKEEERDLEQEQLRKLEEEREREREREKDKMAVEIAIREARERVYADARDRAERTALERATDEARQRAMAEARERLEKACTEARERSLADKASDARLRAERVAVERATAEARQRAIEKVMVERVTLEARERMQRSVSEKYSSSSEREVTRQSSMPSISERSEVDVEPAQRCKARLERHCRTVERVAKALAEKNMRDLLAQREQAERNRFAETLDADIKRWSSGKEGNLRALLSTLQYILGPESGWQSIPLTEVITAAAVKRAYRKATLCVHPDKLQQRGASVQHKYICEKVFDLLKDAWNSFNSEEK